MRHVAAVFLFCLCLIPISKECSAKDNNQVFYVATGSDGLIHSFYQVIKKEYDNKGKVFHFIDLENNNIENNQDALYITVGNRALEHLLQKNIEAHILAIFISRVSFQQILDEYGKSTSDSRISAIYSDPSPLQQFYLIGQLFPHKPKTAVIISGKTAYLRSELKKAAELTAIPLQISVKTEEDIVQIISDIRDAEVIVALPDSSVYNTDSIQRFILSAYRRNQSIIGFSRQLVKAGGLATVYSDHNHIQYETLKAIEHYFSSGLLKPPAYPQLFDVEINEQVAASYNLTLPDKTALKKHVQQSLEACCEK